MSDPREDRVMAYLATLQHTASEDTAVAWDGTRALRPPSESPSRTLRPDEQEILTLNTLPPLSIAHGDGDGGSALADLTLESVLGEGGMGKVLLARQRSLRREVAVKSARDDGDERARVVLVAEAVITGSLEHPNIIPVHALGRDPEGRPMLVMKRVQGTSWRDLIDDPTHAFWARSAYATRDRLVAHLDVLMNVCNALEYAHSRGIIHRDVKPENVLVGAYGEVYLVDWGIALRVERAPDEGPFRIVGTPAFMAPEMVDADHGGIDARTDVYLAGATLHYVLTGNGPHGARTLAATLLNAWRSEPAVFPPSTPAELVAICHRAMRANASERFESAAALRDALSEHLKHRASARLAAEADAKLTEALATPTPTRAALLTEGRFGFMQSLREWSENAAAREGLQKCLVAMIEHDLASENAVGARALLSELDAPARTATLTERLTALDATLAERREAEARMKEIERERDLRVGNPGRMVLVVGMLLMVASISLVLKLRHTDSSSLTLDDLIGLQVVVIATFSAVCLALRKQIMANAIGREIIGAMGLFSLAALGNRLISRAHGLQAEHTLAVDGLILMLALAFSALTIERRAVWLVPITAMGVAVMTRWPSTAMIAYQALMLSTLVGSAYLWKRRAADPARLR